MTWATALTSSGGTLTKLGNGTLTLSAVNTYTGGTTVSAGTLAVTKSSSLPGYATSGKISVNGGATLAINAGGSGEWASTDIDALCANATFSTGSFLGMDTTNASGGFVYSSNISGNFGLTKLGSNTLTLSGINTYSGLTTVSAGELDLNTTNGTAIGGNLAVSGGTAKLLQANQIANGGNLVVSSGTFNLQGYNQTVANVQLTGGRIIGSGGVLPSATAYDMQAGSIGANLGGSVALNKTTSGTVTLSGANSYTGGTNINGGILSLGNSGALGSSGTITFGGGTLQLYDSTDYSSRFSAAAGQAYKIDTNGQSVTLATALISSGGTLTKSGNGTLTLTGANTYTGGTTISAGTLAVPQTLSLPGYATTGNASVAYGATLAVNAGGPGEWASADIDTLRAHVSLLTGSSLGIDTTNALGGFAYANISGNFGLTKLGSNTLTLSGATHITAQRRSMVARCYSLAATTAFLRPQVLRWQICLARSWTLTTRTKPLPP